MNLKLLHKDYIHYTIIKKMTNKNYLEVHNWVKKNINSCQTKEQFSVAKNLIKNFEKQLQNGKFGASSKTHQFILIKSLHKHLEDKYEFLIKI